MRSVWGWVGAAVLVGAVACGGGGAPSDADGGGNVGSNADAGTGTARSDAGGPDGGKDAGADAGTPDGGADGGSSDGGGLVVVPPPTGGWTFYGTNDGLPAGNVMGVTADESGDVWVAGGTQGLFVQRGGTGPFQKFGLADGLHPYGYLNGDMAKFKGVPDGTPADPNPSLAATPVISVGGGPGSTVFVGYHGKQGCEDEWNWQCNVIDPGTGKCIQTTPPSTWGDPANYKSGDADRVTLTGSGISVYHYDVFSGPDVVKAEQGGREKLCSVFRIVWQKGTNNVWLGANHGFALAKADASAPATCNGEYPGWQTALNCAGVYEHTHPAINGYGSDDPTNPNYNKVFFWTADYRGVAVDPLTHDVWFGGMIRTTKFKVASSGSGTAFDNYYTAESLTEDPPYISNRIDVWPDHVQEPNTPRPADQVFDLVSGAAALPDGSVWVSSDLRGLAHISASGTVDRYLTASSTSIADDHIGALATDPDGSIWIGYEYGGGVSRLFPDGRIQHYASTIGATLTNSGIQDIQIQLLPGGRRNVLVAFQTGAVGVYSGN